MLTALVWIVALHVVCLLIFLALARRAPDLEDDDELIYDPPQAAEEGIAPHAHDSMHLYAFRSATDSALFAVTGDPAAPRLPLHQGPWSLWRFEPIRTRLEGMDIAAAERDIKANGFHLCRGLDTATSP